MRADATAVPGTVRFGHFEVATQRLVSLLLKPGKKRGAATDAIIAKMLVCVLDPRSPLCADLIRHTAR